MAADKKANKVVLAYSGGLDTSVIIPWLIENYGCEVICFAADVGQAEELDNLEARALQSGASKLIIGDLKEEFAKDYLFPMIHSGALYERKYFLGTSIARPVIAKHLVQVAEQEGADAIAHGCTGKGNDQVRFELAIMALNPTLKVIAPWREWDITSREDALAYLEAHNIPFPNNNPGLYSRDRNLWHISHEGGKLENLANAPDDSMFMLSNSPKSAPDEPETVEIAFENGNPVAIDGVSYSPAQIVMKLNALGGKHGIGRVDMVENRLVGMKSRGVYETPGGTILYAAHQELESITLDRETMHMKDTLSLQYAKLVYFGQWFTPLREAFDAFFSVTQKAVTGKITLQLYKGNVIVIKRSSPYSLYREEYATFGPSPVYDQSDAAGFIRLFGLSSKVQALIQMDDVKVPQVPIEEIVRD
ncbi:argininosuccinate synthase [Ornatilinea apprima]|uniref:Argininosuccinate synthase n=1 Tax=Ornatilinea apprima TaxID=1134406 RepID=A0A0P6WU20_9CHLR|nr:argininosuccinate synthase [Ornatilinea apprima]KPL73755.1 argininosuccinate synthase [Ornatilinea apprima]